MSSLADLPGGVIIRDEGFSHERTDQGIAEVVRFAVPGAAVDAFVEAVSGLPETVTYPGGIGVTRVVPLKHPLYPNVWAEGLRLFAPGGSVIADVQVDVGEVTNPVEADWFAYEWYEADVRFRTPKFGTDGDFPLVTKTVDAGVEIVTRPGTAYVLPSDGLLVPHNVGVPVATKEIAWTFHRVPGPIEPSEAVWDTLNGRVNHAALQLDHLYPAGTILYLGYSYRGQRSAGNVVTYDVSHRFRYRSVPHNRIMRPDGAGFEAPEDALGDPMIPVADLSVLWQ